MNKTIIAIISVTILLVGGLLIFAKSKKTDAIPNGQTQVNTNPEGPDYTPGATNSDSASPDGKKIAFDAYLSGATGPQQCTVEQHIRELDSTGTVWIDGANARGDFVTPLNGTDVKASFIVKDGYTYTWSSVLASGLRTKNDPNKRNEGVSSGSYVWDPRDIGDYACKAWKVDANKFELPKDVRFTTKTN
jgi:hypothetical protein